MSVSVAQTKVALMREIDDYIAAIKPRKPRRKWLVTKAVGKVKDTVLGQIDYTYVDEIRARTQKWVDSLEITDDELCSRMIRDYITDRKKEIDRFFDINKLKKDRRIFKPTRS